MPSKPGRLTIGIRCGTMGHLTALLFRRRHQLNFSPIGIAGFLSPCGRNIDIGSNRLFGRDHAQEYSRHDGGTASLLAEHSDHARINLPE